MNMREACKQQTVIHGFNVAPSYTRKEACAFLKISMSTLERIIARGEIPVVRIGRSVSLELQDLIDFRNAHKKAA